MEQAGSALQENGVGPAVPTALSGGDQREIQSFETQIQETSKCPRFCARTLPGGGRAPVTPRCPPSVELFVATAVGFLLLF